MRKNNDSTTCKNKKLEYFQRENSILEFWNQNKIFEKTLEQRPIGRPYTFYDGPPFATGLPHYGHILSIVTKDVFPRYWTMKGFHVDRRWGWDCHGLPIESICEKDLKLHQKNEINSYGISKFNEYCRSKVLTYASEWKTTIERMGKWIEFDNSYKTMEKSYMESVWYVFKEIYKKGFVYQGKKILLYCPRCETPLSNSEISMDNSYQEVMEKSAFVKFRIKDLSNNFLLAWTTTPWTLIGNVALAVNGNLKYAKVKVKDEFIILLKNQLKSSKIDNLIELFDKLDKDWKIVDEFKGDKLINLEYEQLYSHESKKRGYYVVEGGNDVNPEEGTGIIHLAIYGEFDYEMIRNYNLPIVQHIGEDGKLIKGPVAWLGTWFKDLDGLVIEDLNQRNLLFQVKNYSHSYPFCYRCDTPLLYNAMDAWFIDIQKIKPQLLEKSKKIKWYPDNVSNRFHYILESAPDWCISRNRFWATAIPIWICKSCRSTKVVGSIDELKENSLENISLDTDLHKHVVDSIHFKCTECGQEMDRIPEVFDCWLESGSMPFASKHYPFENEELLEKNYPSDFVSEYIGQVRAWFYYMLVISVLLKDNIPFRNVVVNGNILASDGKKMSKKLKNYPDPNKLLDKYGADSLRFYLLSSTLMRAQDLNFKEEGVKLIFRKLNLRLVNVLRFYCLFKLEQYDLDIKHSDNVLDEWILSLLSKIIDDSTNAMENYDTMEVCRNIIQFVEELSTFYVNYSKDRFKSTNQNVKSDAINTLSYVLMNLSKLIAPITPFLAEMIYNELKNRNITNYESVHLDTWPVSNKSVNYNVLENIEKTKLVIAKTLEIRTEKRIKIRQVLRKLVIIGYKLEKKYCDIIKLAVNVKECELRDGKEFDIELDTTITLELRLEGISREFIRNINYLRGKLSLKHENPINLYIHVEDNEFIECFNIFDNLIKEKTHTISIFKMLAENLEKYSIKINNKKIEMNLEVL